MPTSLSNRKGESGTDIHTTPPARAPTVGHPESFGKFKTYLDD
ncbi:hypothetical protein [Streptomyces orinoci]|uniref:Uncharacterized protein n=1 Tax=Streptomyces orinoci TaxID=67339 RepID=A0ABV3K7F3_STRON|nr:hypothetical protein [Streptomyces orinoci]